MYSELPSDIRDGHPYHMYDEIKAQPEAVGRSLQLIDAHGAPLVRALTGARRVFIAGCGTSYFGAQIGAWMLRSFSGAAITAQAIQSFELVTYPPALGAGDLVIGVTHSGTTTMTLRVLDLAVARGAATAVVTGFPERFADRGDTIVLETGYNDERSWAHTASATAAVAAFASLASRAGTPDQRLDLSPLPELMAEVLQLEEGAQRLAATTLIKEETHGPIRIVISGAGPNAFTANEGALKLLETAYVAATAVELEEALHGPLAAISPETLFILIAPDGACIDRSVQLAAALEEIGVTPVVLVGEESVERFSACHRFVLPHLPEVLSPLACIVPLQFFSYFLAVGKRLNPDLIHRDDRRYLAAAAAYD